MLRVLSTSLGGKFTSTKTKTLLLEAIADQIFFRYVVQAIKQFLGVPLTVPDDLCYSGFIVDKVMRRTRLLLYDEDVEARPEDMGFFPFVEPAHATWRIAVPAIT